MNLGAVSGEGRVEAAIRSAAGATGIDFDFLLRTAKRESSLNPLAKARTSSATGLFQFVEQTWLSMVKRHGAQHGYGRYAEMIEKGAGGRLHVPDPEARRKVLDLRLDATAASLMAGELAADHASYLKGRIGRDPTSGELYAAHFLGPVGSAKLIMANEQSPGASAASLFPAAAGANRSIFYDKGRPVSVAEVYADLTRSGEGAAPPVRARPAAAPIEVAAAMVRETAAPVAAAVREAALPAVAAVQAAVAPVTRAASAMAERAIEAPDGVLAALHRAEKSRRDALLIDLVLGDMGGGLSHAPFSAELLTLLSDASER